MFPTLIKLCFRGKVIAVPLVGRELKLSFAFATAFVSCWVRRPTAKASLSVCSAIRVAVVVQTHPIVITMTGSNHRERVFINQKGRGF